MTTEAPTVSLTFTLSNDVLDAINEAVSNAEIGYWAESLQSVTIDLTKPLTRDVVLFRVLEAEEDSRVINVTLGAIAVALMKMIAGKWNNKDGREYSCDTYQQTAARDLIMQPDDVDWDALTGDYLLQLAAFGELVYS